LEKKKGEQRLSVKKNRRMGKDAKKKSKNI